MVGKQIEIVNVKTLTYFSKTTKAVIKPEKSVFLIQQRSSPPQKCWAGKCGREFLNVNIMHKQL
jgi:hypothetical protein